MTDPIVFVLAVLTLLATPGPTNTLLAASGASLGIRRSLALVPAEICGYLVSISLLMSVAAPLIAASALAGTLLKIAASLWLLCCATRLWREGGAALHTAVIIISPQRVFMTTLVNPKSLIFALVIIPPGPAAQVAPWLAAFAALVVMVALAWIAVGAGLARSAGHLATPRHICRIASVALTCFAMLVAGSAIAG